MGWESRGGRGRYYTRSRRENGRVIREYVGSGVRGEAAARGDAERRQAQETERAVRRAVREEARAIDRALLALHRTTDQLVRGALLAAGFERYKRQWRVRRVHPSKA
jgi:hypothetical protein